MLKDREMSLIHYVARIRTQVRIRYRHGYRDMAKLKKHKTRTRRLYTC